jgi:AraC-like DNA-binding protein
VFSDASEDVLERAALITQCPVFGLHLGSRQNHAALGAIGRLMSHAPTLGDALGDFVSLQIRNSTGLAAYLHRVGDDFAFGIGACDRSVRISVQIYDLSLAVGCNLVRELTDGEVEPLEILNIRRDPKLIAAYRQIARCPIRFGQSQTCIILSARDMVRKLKGADPKARERCFEELQVRRAGISNAVSAHVRHALRPLLLVGRASLAETARNLSLQPRTLGRRLERDGTKFELIKDEVRFAVARELLTLTELPVSEVGASIDYSNHSAFVRAFRRWTGTTPTLWRRSNMTASLDVA